LYMQKGSNVDEVLAIVHANGLLIDVQRAGPIRPWPARVGSGRPAMGCYGLRATWVDHLRARVAPSAHGPVHGSFYRPTDHSGRI
jgi:hypothetical protein